MHVGISKRESAHSGVWRDGSLCPGRMVGLHRYLTDNQKLTVVHAGDEHRGHTDVVLSASAGPCWNMFRREPREGSLPFSSDGRLPRPPSCSGGCGPAGRRAHALSLTYYTRLVHGPRRTGPQNKELLRSTCTNGKASHCKRLSFVLGNTT